MDGSLHHLAAAPVPATAGVVHQSQVEASVSEEVITDALPCDTARKVALSVVTWDALEETSGDGNRSSGDDTSPGESVSTKEELEGGEHLDGSLHHLAPEGETDESNEVEVSNVARIGALFEDLSAAKASLEPRDGIDRSGRAGFEQDSNRCGTSESMLSSMMPDDMPTASDPTDWADRVQRAHAARAARQEALSQATPKPNRSPCKPADESILSAQEWLAKHLADAMGSSSEDEDTEQSAAHEIAQLQTVQGGPSDRESDGASQPNAALARARGSAGCTTRASLSQLDAASCHTSPLATGRVSAAAASLDPIQADLRVSTMDSACTALARARTSTQALSVSQGQVDHGVDAVTQAIRTAALTGKVMGGSPQHPGANGSWAKQDLADKITELSHKSSEASNAEPVPAAVAANINRARENFLHL